MEALWEQIIKLLKQSIGQRVFRPYIYLTHQRGQRGGGGGDEWDGCVTVGLCVCVFGGWCANEHSLLGGCDVRPDGVCPADWLAGWLHWGWAHHMAGWHWVVIPQSYTWGQCQPTRAQLTSTSPGTSTRLMSVSLECRLKSSLAQPLTELGAGLAAPLNVNEGGQLFPSSAEKAQLLWLHTVVSVCVPVCVLSMQFDSCPK